MNNSAFPHDDGPLVVHGLTKRELFAAMAMNGICGDGIPGRHHEHKQTAQDAVTYADALIAALEAK